MKQLTIYQRNLRRVLQRDAQERSTTFVGYIRGQRIRRVEYSVPKTADKLMMLEAKYAQLRLRRKAYICAKGHVLQCNDEGFSTVTNAFIHRPNECQFCVFETDSGRALLVDMFDLTASGNPPELEPKTKVDEFETVQAAIMFAVITY